MYIANVNKVQAQGILAGVSWTTVALAIFTV